ncbi:zinc finger protein 271-like [Cimex lectularius]|uniref:C2H2-type domain-containing protein n=1 Tax=Cimex lectularius TaxID=79782 RepID=A0A8I6RGB1_CIMLE|nr:zinc finger protein 271-like [Cimex lectularius]
MAEMESIEDCGFREEFVFVEEYFPLDLHEEEVVAETVETEEVVAEEQEENDEVIHATNSILPEGYDPMDPNQWAQEEVIIESSEPIIKEENEEQAHVYECYKCAKRFNYKDKLFKHMKLHHARGDDMMIERDGKRIWTCTQCDKTFISRKGSIIHQRTHTGERPYSCSVCQKRFIDSSTLMKHQVIHQAVRPFSCLICRRGFNQKVALQRHERTHGQLQPTYKCKFCPKTFLVASSLQAHEKIHSGIKPYTCQYCPSRFHTSTAQRQHERVHTNERPYACSYCPKAFKDSGTLFKHQVIHSGIRPFVCPICSQGFTQKVALRKHIRSHVSRNQDNTCEICATQYFNKDDLCIHIEAHIETHPSLSHVRNVATSSLKKQEMIQVTPVKAASPEPERTEESDMSDLATLCDVAISTAGDLAHSYPCLHCGMSFRRKKSLDSHLSIHRMTCKYCERPFPDKASLETHERKLCNLANSVQQQQAPRPSTQSDQAPTKTTTVQTGTKQPKRFFYCERCDKTFSSRNGYIIHQRSHTGERPYPCRWCNKAFGDSATRHKHERIHTGERPFKCPRCPRAFNQRAALRAHQITHTVDRAFLCKYCPSSFPYFATLKRHQQSCHSQIPCPICFTFVPDGKKLHNHIKEEHAVENNLSCTICDSGIFTDADEYCDHMVWHGKQQQPNKDTTSQHEEVPINDDERNDDQDKSDEIQFEQLHEGVVKEEIVEEETEEVVLEEEEFHPEEYQEEEEEEMVQREEIIEQTIVTDDFPIVEEAYPCDMCGILFQDKELLKEHIPLHF